MQQLDMLCHDIWQQHQESVVAGQSCECELWFVT